MDPTPVISRMENKVLVVDDDAHIRAVISFALRKHGFTTVEAGDGLKADDQNSNSQRQRKEYTACNPKGDPPPA